MFAKSWTTGRAKKNRDSGGAAQYPAIRGSVRHTGEPTSTGISRQEHLDSYLNDEVLGRSTMKVSSDDTTYDTVFSTVSGNTLIVRVHFPAIAFTPGASTRAPEMKLTGVAATHKWIDGIGKVTGFAPISSDRIFRESGITLGAAVKQVVQEFQLNPPSITKFTDKNLENMQPRDKLPPPPAAENSSAARPSSSSASSTGDSAPPSYDTLLNNNGGGNSGGGVYVPPQQPATPQPSSVLSSIALPAIPTEFPELEEMEREALDELLNNELAFLAFCNNLPYTQQLDEILSQKSKEAERMATENLSKQAELQELHASTRMLHEQLKSIVEDCQVLEQQQDSLQEKPDERHVLKELTRARREAFDESEQIAEKWLAKEKADCVETMAEFSDVFLEKRRIHHLRAAKIQILNRQHQQQAQQGNGWHPAKRL